MFFNSLDAFRFIDAAGNSTPVRWSMVPVQPFVAEDTARAAEPDKNYLFDALIAELGQGPLQWHLVVTIGRPGDPTDDATAAWPDDREHVDVGTLTIEHAEGEATGPCRDVNFDPLVLPRRHRAVRRPAAERPLRRLFAILHPAGRRSEDAERGRDGDGAGRSEAMTGEPQFTALSRLLHWLMAAMILAMLFIGIAMVASLADYHDLVSIHRPLGIAILVLVVVRIANRLFNPPPPLPRHMAAWERLAAKSSHLVLYGLMIAMPLVGWGMMSAERYPVTLWGSLVLPPILPHDPMLHAALRGLHTWLAYLLFATILAHLAAALMHALIHRDGVFASMAPWKPRRDEAGTR